MKKSSWGSRAGAFLLFDLIKPAVIFATKLSYGESITVQQHFTFSPKYKNSDTFANCKYEELSYPKNLKMCDPF